MSYRGTVHDTKTLTFFSVNKTCVNIDKGEDMTKSIKTLFHIFGLSCVGGAMFLELLVFTDILTQGYFRAAEKNLVVLGIETLIAGFSTMYFIYIYQKFIRSIT